MRTPRLALILALAIVTPVAARADDPPAKPAAPDPGAGPKPDPGAEPKADAVIAWCKANMANYKVPRYVELLDALPMNAMGKVTKFVLREFAKSKLQPPVSQS